MTACDMEQTRIPPFAVHKISQVIDDLCGDILRGQGELMQDWETARYFQGTLGCPKGRMFLLAEIFIVMQNEECIDWSYLVKLLEEFDDEYRTPTKLIILSGLQQDVLDLLQIPREDTENLQKYLDMMQEEYAKDFPNLVSILKALVLAYREGHENDLLQLRPFAKDRIITKLRNWLTEQRDNPTRDAQVGLDQARDQLRNAVAEDPLREARRIASKVKHQTSLSQESSQGGQLYKKKKSSHQIKFTQDDDTPYIEEEAHVEEGTHQLSEIPVKYVPSTNRDASPDNHDTPTKFRRWTDEQRLAFRDAVQYYGAGNWAAIRDAPEYQRFWGGKSNIQLKDLFRVMRARGEI